MYDLYELLVQLNEMECDLSAFRVSCLAEKLNIDVTRTYN